MIIIYKFLLYLKYIKHCVIKIPLNAITMSSNEYKNIDDINMRKNKIYSLCAPNNKIMNANFIKYKNKDINITHYAIGYIYHWNILGYKNAKTIYNCNWNEFKQLYATIFYPHLIQEDQIIADATMDNLSDQNSMYSVFVIQTFKKLKDIQ